MNKLKNTVLKQNVIDACKIEQANDDTNLNVGNVVHPVVNVSEYNTQIKNFTASTTGQSTLLTASSTKRTFITRVSYSIAKDAVCDAATGRFSLNAVVKGATIELITIPYITLTAQTSQVNVSLSRPLLIDKSSSVTFTGSFTVGLLVKSGLVEYYEID